MFDDVDATFEKIKDTGANLAAVIWDNEAFPLRGDARDLVQQDISDRLQTHVKEKGIALIDDDGEIMHVTRPWMMRLSRIEDVLCLQFADCDKQDLVGVHRIPLLQACIATDAAQVIDGFCVSDHMTRRDMSDEVKDWNSVCERPHPLNTQRFMLDNSALFAEALRDFAVHAATYAAPVVPAGRPRGFVYATPLEAAGMQ